MIDTDKYEGHTPAPWTFKGPQGLDLENETHAVVSLYDNPRMRQGGEADMLLIADAPLLLDFIVWVKNTHPHYYHKLTEAYQIAKNNR